MKLVFLVLMVLGCGLVLLASQSDRVEAGKVDITGVKVRKSAPLIFTFDVAVRHTDTGWKHYANKWEIVAPDGTVLGTRTLLHPHVDEQPFTRSLSNVRIPRSINSVIVRGYDLVHGAGGIEMTVAVPH